MNSLTPLSHCKQSSCSGSVRGTACLILSIPSHLFWNFIHHYPFSYIFSLSTTIPKWVSLLIWKQNHVLVSLEKKNTVLLSVNHSWVWVSWLLSSNFSEAAGRGYQSPHRHIQRSLFDGSLLSSHCHSPFLVKICLWFLFLAIVYQFSLLVYSFLLLFLILSNKFFLMSPFDCLTFRFSPLNCHSVFCPLSMPPDFLMLPFSGRWLPCY